MQRRKRRSPPLTPRAAWHTGAVWLGLLLGGVADAADFRDAQALLEAYAADVERAAVAAAVVRGDALLWSGATGTANRARGIAAGGDTVFLIGSISKTVTATAAMQLVEAGRLELDRDVNAYLPFAVRNPQRPGAAITLRHLLTHTSGIRDIYLRGVLPDLMTETGDPEVSLARFCRAFLTPGGAYYYPATFTSSPPGTAFDYSNLGFALVGCVVEGAAGEPFAAFTERRIFAPLGMTRTSPRVADFRAAELAVPYGLYNEVYGNYTFPDYPAGALRTTVGDLSKFLRAFMLGGTLDGQTILEPASVRELRRVQYPGVDGAEQQGLGWTEFDFGDGSRERTFLGHFGEVPGGSTLMAYDPATQTGGVVFTNGNFSGEADVDALVTFLLKLTESVGRRADELP